MRVRVSRWPLPATAAAFLLSANLFAQTPPPPANEAVYSTNSSNDAILKLDFDAGTSTVVNTDAGQRVRIEGIGVRNDVAAQHLLVCDRGSGEVLFYENAAGAGQAITSEIRLPHSVSLDQSGNAYVVSAIKREVWKLPIGGTRPGGYGTPVLIDTISSSSLIKEAKLVPFSAGGLQSGGLVVLSRIPALVYFYPPDPQSPTGFGPRQVFIPTSAFNAGTQPTGFAFAPNQDLLIAVQQGKVLRYSPGGQRVLPDFAAGFGKGLVKIAVGVQGGLSRAFVADPKAGGKLHRLLINSDGTGTIDAAVKSGVSVPGGVNSASAAGSAPTPAGSNVEVSPAPPVELTFDNVSAPGITTAEIVEFVDNRGPLNGGNYYVAQNLKDFFSPSDPLYSQLPNVTIPANIQAFKKGDPNTGVPTFLMSILDTTATFGRTVEFHYDESAQLGYEPDCADPDLTLQPRTFYAPETDPPKSEPPIVEGNVFVDFSAGCGSNIGRGGRFSLWLTGRETDLPVDTADSQLGNMTAAMDFYPCIDADLRAALDAELQSAVAAFADYKQSGDPDDQALAIAHLNAYIAVVDASPGGFANCTASLNIGGELIARAQAASFSISKVVVTPSGGIKALIVHSDYSGSPPQAELMATGKFSQVDLFDATLGTPSLATLQQYPVVLAYTNFTPLDPTGLGDVLADYVDSGGGVALATYSFSTPWSIAGRITTSGYSPLVNVSVNADVSGALSAVVPSDPVFDGVNLSLLTYFHNVNFAHPGLASGATLVATDGAGVNMIARSGSSSVIGLNLFPGNVGGGNNSEFYTLLANAIVSVEGE